MIEPNLAKVGVEGSNPFARSNDFNALGDSAFAAKSGLAACVLISVLIRTPANSLPKPMFMNMSGHGTQVFWTLEQAIAAADWLPVEENLPELAKRCGLGADRDWRINPALGSELP